MAACADFIVLALRPVEGAKVGGGAAVGGGVAGASDAGGTVTGAIVCSGATATVVAGTGSASLRLRAMKVAAARRATPRPPTTMYRIGLADAAGGGGGGVRRGAIGVRVRGRGSLMMVGSAPLGRTAVRGWSASSFGTRGSRIVGPTPMVGWLTS